MSSTFNIKAAETGLLVKTMKWLSSKPYIPGELLAFKAWAPEDLVFDKLNKRFERLYPFRAGHPVLNTGSAEYGQISTKGKPFMFLGWAAYDKIWNEPFQVFKLGIQPIQYDWRLQMPYTGKSGQRGFLIGMNVLYAKQIFFLTTHYGCTWRDLDETPLGTDFIGNVKPLIRRWNPTK